MFTSPINSPFGSYPQPFATTNSLASLVNQLFSTPENAKEILASYMGNGVMDELLSEIWNRPLQSDEAKLHLIEKVAPHLSFVKSMTTLFEKDSLTALFITASLPSNQRKWDVLDSLLKDQTGYQTLLECWQLLVSSIWEDNALKQEPLELLFADLSEEERWQLFQLCCEQCSPSEQGQLCILLATSSYQAEFTSAWDDVFDSNPEIDTKLHQLICSMIANHRGNSLVPPILFHLLSPEDKNNDLGKTAFENLDQFTDREQGIILSSLLPLSLSDLIKDFDPMTDRGVLISQMEKILSFSESAEEKTKAVGIYLELIDDEETLIAWMTELQDRFSSAALYLWPALPNNLFAFVITDPATVSLRSNLMRIATLTKANDLPEFVSYCLKNTEKIEHLFSICTLDIVSQDQMQIENETFGRWMTFSDFANIVQTGINTGNLSEQLNQIKEDFQKLPPLLLALGMTFPSHQAWIAKAALYCTDEQLEAIASLLSVDDMEILDRLAESLMTDQFKLTLKHLTSKTLEAFAKHKTAACTALLQDIQQVHRETQARLNDLESHEQLPETEVLDDLLVILGKQTGKIMQFSHKPLNDLVDRCLSEKFGQEIANLQRQSKAYEADLKFFFQRIDKMRSSLPIPQKINLDDLPKNLLAFAKAATWQETGIFSEKDLQHLGYTGEETSSLEKYLSQPELLKIWKLFTSKGLGNISSLIDSCVAEPEELFNLADIAKKLVIEF